MEWCKLFAFCLHLVYSVSSPLPSSPSPCDIHPLAKPHDHARRTSRSLLGIPPSSLTQPAPERLRTSFDNIHDPLPVPVWSLYLPVYLFHHAPLGTRRPGVRLDDVQLLGVVSCLTPVCLGRRADRLPAAFAGRMTVGAGVQSEGHVWCVDLMCVRCRSVLTIPADKPPLRIVVHAVAIMVFGGLPPSRRIIPPPSCCIPRHHASMPKYTTSMIHLRIMRP